MKMLRLILLGLMIAALPAAARAEWREASSPHFLVYGDASEQALHAAAVKLERFHRVVRWASNVSKEDPPVKLRVFLMHSTRQLQDTMKQPREMVLGYYAIGARGPVAFGLLRDPKDIRGMDADDVLFHEYAHHLMFQYFPAVYPAWYREGFAEFYGRTRISDDDVVEIGHAALNRYMSFGDWMPLSRLLTARTQADFGLNAHAAYSQGWLLVHYLTNSSERKGQLERYLGSINQGASYQQAMETAFGPGARDLDRELRTYSRRRGIPATRIPFKPIDAGGIRVRALGADEQAMIRLEMQYSRGLLQREATKFADEVRGMVERFPDSPYALSMLVEAERAAGNTGNAEAAVDRWLRLQPGTPRALMHKAQLQIERLSTMGSTEDSTWQAARKHIVDAIKSDPNDPRLLGAYYDSFAATGVLPPVGAQNGLHRAFELVPQDYGLRYKLARDFEHRGMIQDAISTIKPAAFSLHDEEEESESEKRRRERLETKLRGVGETKGETAREMLARLEAKLADKPQAVADADAD